jgi:hypothetical protein
LPTIDPAGMTAYMAGNVMLEFLFVIARQKKDGKR